MTDDDQIGVTEDDWEDFWANLSPVWRRVLSGSDTDTAPPPGPILQRRRMTTDFDWVGTFEPLRWLPAVTEALLWDVNGHDLAPLTGRSWDLLQLAGPAQADLAQMRGTPIRRLILSNVDVTGMSTLRDIPGLVSLTLAHGDFGSLPPLAHLTELVLYAEARIDYTAVCGNPGLQVTDVDQPYFPPFGPDEQ
jgi:hypothetical protein